MRALHNVFRDTLTLHPPRSKTSLSEQLRLVVVNQSDSFLAFTHPRRKEQDRWGKLEINTRHVTNCRLIDVAISLRDSNERPQTLNPVRVVRDLICCLRRGTTLSFLPSQPDSHAAIFCCSQQIGNVRSRIELLRIRTIRDGACMRTGYPTVDYNHRLKCKRLNLSALCRPHPPRCSGMTQPAASSTQHLTRHLKSARARQEWSCLRDCRLNGATKPAYNHRRRRRQTTLKRQKEYWYVPPIVPTYSAHGYSHNKTAGSSQRRTKTSHASEFATQFTPSIAEKGRVESRKAVMPDADSTPSSSLASTCQNNRTYIAVIQPATRFPVEEIWFDTIAPLQVVAYCHVLTTIRLFRSQSAQSGFCAKHFPQPLPDSAWQ